MPRTAWRKKDIVEFTEKYIRYGNKDADFSIIKFEKISADVLKEKFLVCSSIHYCKKTYRSVYYFKLDTALLDELTDEDIIGIILNSKERELRDLSYR